MTDSLRRFLLGCGVECLPSPVRDRPARTNEFSTVWATALGRKWRAVHVPGGLGAWISGRGGDTKDTAEALGTRWWGHQPSWAELYWVPVPVPGDEAMFSRPCSMASLPTQVCILVAAWLALCKTKAAASFLGTRPAGKCADLGECVLGKAWGAPVPCCLERGSHARPPGAPDTGDAGSMQCRLHRLMDL